MSIKRTVEDSEAEDENTAPSMDKSTVEATPVREQSEGAEKGRKRRHRKTKGQKVSATTQVSFDDSIACNEADSEASTVLEESRAKRPRRGERVSKARPTKQYKSSVTDDPDDTTSSILSDASNVVLQKTDEELSWKTPAPNKKRKLFSQTPRPDVSFLEYSVLSIIIEKLI